MRRALALAVIVLLATLGLTQAASAQQAEYPTKGTPNITCSPTSPVAGDSLTATATEFSPDSTVTFAYAPDAGAAFVGFGSQDFGSATATADGSGTASTQFTINTAGNYTVTAAGTGADGAPTTASTTITIQAASSTGGTSASGTGGTSASGRGAASASTGGATTSGTGGTTASTGGTTSSSAGGTTASSGGTESAPTGSSLPRTGSNAGILLAIAGGAVLIGGLALVGARARRQTKDATLN